MIRATDIAVGYGGSAVSGPLSFSYADGQCIMLRGRNGSGKTTLMKTLAGLMKPVSGFFEAGGEVILVPTRIPKVKGSPSQNSSVPECSPNMVLSGDLARMRKWLSRMP